MRARRADVVLAWDKQPDEMTPTRLIGAELRMSHPDRARARHRHAGAGVPDVRDRAARRIGASRSTTHQVRIVRAVGPLQRGRGGAIPYAWVARCQERRGDPHAGPDEPHDRLAVSEAHELEQRRRHGRRGDHVLGRAGARPRRPRGPVGVPPRRRRRARHRLRLEPRRPPLVARDPHRRPRARCELAGIGIDDFAHVDLYSCFPSAVQIGADELGLGLDRAPHRHRRAVLRRRSVEQLRDARHRHDGRAVARIAGCVRARQRQRRLRHEARVRRLLHHAACRGVPRRAPTGRGRCDATSRAGGRLAPGTR